MTWFSNYLRSSYDGIWYDVDVWQHSWLVWACCPTVNQTDKITTTSYMILSSSSYIHRVKLYFEELLRLPSWWPQRKLMKRVYEPLEKLRERWWRYRGFLSASLTATKIIKICKAILVKVGAITENLSLEIDSLINKYTFVNMFWDIIIIG